MEPTPSPPQTTTTSTATGNNTTSNSIATQSNQVKYDIDESMMEDYLAMGFGEDQVRRALIKFRGRLSQCISFNPFFYFFILLYFFIFF